MLLEIPWEGSSINDDSSDGISPPVQVFGGRMDHNIRSHAQRTCDKRRCGRGIHDQRDPCFMCDAGYLRNIKNLQRRIGYEFAKDCSRARADQRPYGFCCQLRNIYDMNPYFFKIVKKSYGSSIKTVSGNDLITALAYRKERGRDRGHPATAAYGTGSSLKFLYPLLKRGNGRIADAGIRITHTFMEKNLLQLLHALIAESRDL